MTFIVQASFKARSGEVRRGQIIAMPEDKAEVLVRAGKIAELQPCPICGTFSWWLSIHGVLVCGVCHPPMPATVKKWIGDPEAYGRMKAARPALVLSWEEIRQRKVSHEDR